MAARGELLTAGRRVSDIGSLLDEARSRWGLPKIIGCDRWREAELRQALEAAAFPLTALEVTRTRLQRRRQSDLRAFRAACLFPASVRPAKSSVVAFGYGRPLAYRFGRGREREAREKDSKAGGGRRLAMMLRRRRSWRWRLARVRMRAATNERAGALLLLRR